MSKASEILNKVNETYDRSQRWTTPHHEIMRKVAADLRDIGARLYNPNDLRDSMSSGIYSKSHNWRFITLQKGQGHEGRLSGGTPEVMERLKVSLKKHGASDVTIK